MLLRRRCSEGVATFGRDNISTCISREVRLCMGRDDGRILSFGRDSPSKTLPRQESARSQVYQRLPASFEMDFPDAQISRRSSSVLCTVLMFQEAAILHNSIAATPRIINCRAEVVLQEDWSYSPAGWSHLTFPFVPHINGHHLLRYRSQAEKPSACNSAIG